MARTTERAPGPRASRRELRAWAWIAGGLAFFAPWAALGASPRPATEASRSEGRPVIVVRTITRRIVVHDRPVQAPVRYVPVDESASGPSEAGTAVQTAPATSTGGS